MPRDKKMDNDAFEEGEAVLLAARCLHPEAYHGGGGGQRGGWREAALEAGEARRGGGGLPQETQTNGGPPCHCPPDESQEKGELPAKTPSAPLPVVVQQSPWHRHKSIFLVVIVVTLIVWIIVYTVISQMDLA